MEEAGVPFIVKGIMTVKGALKAKEAGAAAIVVSNHGGRVLDQCPSTAEVLEEIAQAVDGSMKSLVDGGREGVESYVNKIGGELKDTMAMCGVASLDEITRDCVRI